MSKIKDLGDLERRFKKFGFELAHSEIGPMDYGTAVFSNGRQSIKIIKDKSQWFFDSDKVLLRSLGLWKAFDKTNEFCDAIELLVRSLK